MTMASTLLHQTAAFPADGCGNLYGMVTDSENSQLYEFTINEHCSINQGSLIDSGIFTVTIQLPVIGYQVLLCVDVCQSGPLAEFCRRDYACQWSLGNSTVSGPALRQRAFLTLGFRLESVRPVSTIGRWAGVATRKGASCTYRQFPKPVRLPATRSGYFPILGDKPVANPDISTPRELAFYRHHLETMRNAAYGINAITRITREMNVLRFEEESPDWWNGWAEDGLCSAVDALASRINDTLEFLQGRVEEHRAGETSDGPR